MANVPIRFIHTADWQLGLRVRYIPGDAGATVRSARLQTVQRIEELAREHEAAFVVVAGDVFEHHQLRPSTVRKAFDVLGEFDRPVYLLPGNHDPLTPDSLYKTDLWQRECPGNVRVLATTDPVEVRDDAWLLPCPVADRHALEDPTEHLDRTFGPGTGFRIGVAHGGIREILEGLADDERETGAAVSLDACERGGLDYLALGDWHGTLRVDDRTWYAGTPDATRFKESDPGNVLLVELSAPGAVPAVAPLPVASLEWRRLERDLNETADVEALGRELDALPDKTRTLVELWLTGTLELEQFDALEREVLDRARDRFLWLRLRDTDLHTSVSEDDLDAVAGEGWLADVVAGLRRGQTDDDSRALQLLYRLHREVTA